MPPLSVSDILVRARERAAQMNLPYAGALLPAEAQVLLEQVPGAKLIDVRTQPEWEYVGHVPNSVLVEWNTYPTGQRNQQFLQELESKVPKTDAPVMFLCRSGQGRIKPPLPPHDPATPARSISSRDSRGTRTPTVTATASAVGDSPVFPGPRGRRIPCKRLLWTLCPQPPSLTLSRLAPVTGRDGSQVSP